MQRRTRVLAAAAMPAAAQAQPAWSPNRPTLAAEGARRRPVIEAAGVGVE